MMDEHVPKAITIALRRRGVDVLTAQEDGSDSLNDDLLLRRAADLGRVLITRDEDFLGKSALWQAGQQSFAGIVYLHQLRVSIGKAVEDLELMAKVLEPEDIHNCLHRLPL